MLKGAETKILGSQAELREIVSESGHIAETLFERVNEGYDELTVMMRKT